MRQGLPDTGRRSARRRWLVTSLLALVALTALGWGIYAMLHIQHFRTVTSGVLYRSSTLPRHELDRAYRRTGMRTIVVLREWADQADGSWYEVEREFAAAHGVDLVTLPLRARQMPSPEDVRRFLAIVTNAAAQPVLVHCEFGVIRTGMMVAAYQVLVEKRDGQQVLQKLPLFGRHLPAHPEISNFVRSLRAPPVTPIPALPMAANGD